MNENLPKPFQFSLWTLVLATTAGGVVFAGVRMGGLASLLAVALLCSCIVTMVSAGSRGDNVVNETLIAYVLGMTLLLASIYFKGM